MKHLVILVTALIIPLLGGCQNVHATQSYVPHPQDVKAMEFYGIDRNSPKEALIRCIDGACYDISTGEHVETNLGVSGDVIFVVEFEPEEGVKP